MKKHDNIFRDLHNKYYIITTYLRQRNHLDMQNFLKEEKLILKMLDSEQLQSLGELGLMLPLKIIQGQRNHRELFDYLNFEFSQMDTPGVFREYLITAYRKIYNFWDNADTHNIKKVLTRAIFRIPTGLSKHLNLKRTNHFTDKKYRAAFFKDPKPFYQDLKPLLTPNNYQQLNQLVFKLLQKNFRFPDVLHMSYAFANYHWENLFEFDNSIFKVKTTATNLITKLKEKEDKLKWAKNKRFTRTWTTNQKKE